MKKVLIIILLVSLILISGCKSKEVRDNEALQKFNQELNQNPPLTYQLEMEAGKIFFEGGDLNLVLSKLQEFKLRLDNTCPKYNQKIQDIRVMCVNASNDLSMRIDLIKNVNEEVCKKYEQDLAVFVHCYSYLAVLTGDENYCKKDFFRKDVNEGDVCLSYVAKRYKREELCETMNNPNFKVSCQKIFQNTSS